MKAPWSIAAAGRYAPVAATTPLPGGLRIDSKGRAAIALRQWRSTALFGAS
jgi:hypothetical protein